ncbi:MAG: hypothetical protein ABIU85_00585 [Methylotenera sp.]
MKLIFFLVFAFIISNNSYADTFIPYDGGKLVLFALPGCAGPKEPQDRMFGIWQKQGDEGKTFCWSYNKVISIYFMDGKVLTLSAEDIVVENNGAIDHKDPAHDHDISTQLPTKLSAMKAFFHSNEVHP